MTEITLYHVTLNSFQGLRGRASCIYCRLLHLGSRFLLLTNSPFGQEFETSPSYGFAIVLLNAMPLGNIGSRMAPVGVSLDFARLRSCSNAQHPTSPINSFAPSSSDVAPLWLTLFFLKIF